MPKLRAVLAPMTLALLMAGCSHKTSGENGADAVAADAGTLASDAGTSIANAADNVKEAVTPTPTGQEFADKAAKSDAFEIAAAKLAKLKAESADIKSFAAMMATDHTASTAKIKKAASAASSSITPNPVLTVEQSRKLADLGKLSGADFDKEYARQQVDAHRSALSLMTLYADHGDVPSLKEAAGEIKPKVQSHLAKINAIKDKLS